MGNHSGGMLAKPLSGAKMRVCLVTFYLAYGDNPETRLSDLLSIFKPLAKEIFLITSLRSSSHPIFQNEKIHLINIKYPSQSRFMIVKALKVLTAQLAISWRLIKISRHIDTIFWGISTDILIIPMLLARLVGKKNINFVAGKGFEEMRLMHSGVNGFILSKTQKIIQEGTYLLSHAIVVISTELLKEPWLSKHRGKVFPYALLIRIIDTDIFRVSQPLRQRQKLIGYVGKLHREKGIMNFIRAIPLVLERQRDLEFVVIGEGPQTDQIRGIIAENNLSTKVRLTGWVNHKELPLYLNQMQLMVLPSFTEGLGLVALEAMACGTPVLGTSVGGIRGIIRDGETGFTMENNSPECIAKGILRALDHPGLDEVTTNARILVEKEYTYEATVEGYRKLFASLLKGHGTL